MTDSIVNCSRGQMKIQQMAFILVAVMIFFALVGLVYFVFVVSNLEGSAQELADEEARQTARKLAGSAEFVFSSSGDCSSCLDMDKVLMLKESSLEEYEDFWNFDYFMIERLGVEEEGECTKVSYPSNCDRITLIDGGESLATVTAFVTLARWDGSAGSAGNFRYELGRVHVSAEDLI